MSAGVVSTPGTSPQTAYSCLAFPHIVRFTREVALSRQPGQVGLRASWLGGLGRRATAMGWVGQDRSRRLADAQHSQEERAEDHLAAADERGYRGQHKAEQGLKVKSAEPDAVPPGKR